ncbi:hypothetical protein [Micromonospora sp. NPDC048898]|uniref:hypothetical protein n=1 Tax=Micromonospora sp. NPDC048898 TaxID=3364260 RepID=UPI00371A9CAC
MENFKVRIYGPADLDSAPETTTRTVAWAYEAELLAGHLGARTAQLYRGWHTVEWCVTVEGNDITATHTAIDELNRVDTRAAIVAQWEDSERDLHKSIATACASMAPEVIEAAKAGVSEMLRNKAKDDLSGLGYHLIESPSGVAIIDARTEDGMMTLLRYTNRTADQHRTLSTFAYEERDSLILAGWLLGATPTQLSGVLGLSTERVQQIRREETERERRDRIEFQAEGVLPELPYYL